jgi:hypothetical protein
VTGRASDTYLRAVQSAAVDRALTSETDAREYLALAGALEAPVSSEDVPGDEPRPRGLPDDASALLGAALASVASTVALSGDDAGRADVPWVPQALVADGIDTDAFVLEGAVVACRRFDLPTERAAALASLPAAELRTELECEP